VSILYELIVNTSFFLSFFFFFGAKRQKKKKKKKLSFVQMVHNDLNFGGKALLPG
jgi:preprotein translocase subunit YajC